MVRMKTGMEKLCWQLHNRKLRAGLLQALTGWNMSVTMV